MIDPTSQQTRFYAGDELLAVYNNGGNTFTEFHVGGMNLLGGYAPGANGTNDGPPVAGHPAPYPFGQIGGGAYSQWEGFWAGYNYVDRRWGAWTGVNGNPGAVRSFEVAADGADAIDVHVVSEVGWNGTALFECDVHYRVTRAGIGVRSDVHALSDLEPQGVADLGGQLLMAQADSDVDPALPLDSSQPSQYFRMAFDDYLQDIDPYPPYNVATPSNMYDDTEVASPPEQALHALPNTALVPAGRAVTYTSTLGRADRAWNVALRVDLVRSSIPPLEYYCEVNGARDYLNFVYTPAIGSNRAASVQTVAAGTRWRLYGDLRPWNGTDATVLATLPLLSDPLP